MPGLVAPIANEREGLLAYLAQQRDAFRIVAYGLSDEQARATPTVSTLSVGGLIKHVAFVESGWIDTMLGRPGAGAVESANSGDDFEESQDAYADNFVLGPDETLAGALDAYAAVAARRKRQLPASTTWTRPSRCRRVCPGTPTTSRRGRCGGSSST